MEFRPCIDIHNGKVKQIVGASLRDEGDAARENYVSEKNADYFAGIYRDKNIKGGHVILLNGADSEYYEATKQQAMLALSAYPGGLQVGGGINPDNASAFLDAGASHVIVTSYVFSGGAVNMDNLKKMKAAVGREHLVLDMSCKRTDRGYLVVTDRWQKYTDQEVTLSFLDEISEYCDEFLIHGVDVEGTGSGIDTCLVELLAGYEGVPVTYAGGIGNFEKLEELRRVGGGRINATIGSALDLFGGDMPLDRVLKICNDM